MVNQKTINAGILFGIFALVGIIGVFGSQALSALDEGDSSVSTVATDTHTVDGVVPLQTDIGSADVYLFEEQPEADSPVNWGDFEDFDASEATSGLTEGVDYHVTSISDADEAVFDDLEAGTYSMALVDESEPRDFHNNFEEVTMPSEVRETIYESEGEVTLEGVTSTDFTRFATYDTDDATTFDEDGSSVALSANMDTPDSDVDDRERTVERTVEIQSGEEYLGELELNNIIDSEDAVDEMVVTVSADGSQPVSEDFGGETGDSSSETVTIGDSDDPEKVSDEIGVTVDLVYDAAAEGTSDDDRVDEDEEVVSVDVVDIYGDSGGTEAPLTIEG